MDCMNGLDCGLLFIGRARYYKSATRRGKLNFNRNDVHVHVIVMAIWFFYLVLLYFRQGWCVQTESSEELGVSDARNPKGEPTNVDSESSDKSLEENSEDRSNDYEAEKLRWCTNFICPEAQECELDANMHPYCSCDLSCAEIYDPVCGTDGKTYSNMCKLTLASCDTKRDIDLIYEGRCGSLKSTGWYLLMKIALPTGIVATVVFLCLVICWCRKGAEYQYRCCPPHLPSYEEDERTYRRDHNVEPIIPVQYNNGPISMVTIPSDVHTNSNGIDPQQRTSLLSNSGHHTPPPSYDEATRS